MKKRFTIILLLIVLVATCTTFVACGENDPIVGTWTRSEMNTTWKFVVGSDGTFKYYESNYWVYEGTWSYDETDDTYPLTFIKKNGEEYISSGEHLKIEQDSTVSHYISKGSKIPGFTKK